MVSLFLVIVIYIHICMHMCLYNLLSLFSVAYMDRCPELTA